jgi:hypothetical protein
VKGGGGTTAVNSTTRTLIFNGFCMSVHISATTKLKVFSHTGSLVVVTIQVQEGIQAQEGINARQMSLFTVY